MTSAGLALRTRLFGTVMRRLAREPETAAQMIALRSGRDRLRESAVGRFVCGAEADVATRDVPVDDDIRLRVHRPHDATGPLPVVVNFHGGGWCLGAPEQSGWLASHVAARSGAMVVSPSYRLAPEHPYPAAIQDTWRALTWVAEHAADLGADPDRLAVMGDSAGGNLAAVAALTARDAGAPVLRGQVLIYPAVEMYDRYPSEDEFERGIMLTSKQMRIFGRLYLGASYGIEDWQASPLRAASHAGLAPALIVTAHQDPLRDHGARYTAALRAGGTEVDLRDYGPGIHGFMSLPGVVPVARQALGDIVAFLRERL